MNQQNLFAESSHRRIETPAFRANDPISSELAAADVTASGKRHAHMSIVIDAVRRCPGLTSAELYMEIKQAHPLTRHEVARRLPDARTAGAVSNAPWIVDPDVDYMRKCELSDRLSLTWWPLEVAAK